MALVVAHNIRAARAASRMTQAELAQAMTDAGVKVSRWAVASIEKDERHVDLAELVVLCEILDVTLADLLRGRGEDAVRARRALGL